jgi:molybdopterin/thiamine biosynthesis adenylyltransferase
MNLSKHSEFFDPLTMINSAIHIIGCGAIGSTVAEMLTRMGITQLHIYDFDTVNPHNIANQMFYVQQINKPKLDSIEEILYEINPDIAIYKHEDGYTGQPLSGYVFLCVDNIDLRRKICEQHQYNTQIKAVFDFRMRLTDAQHYAADWSDPDSIANLLGTMQFSHDEAKTATPISACGTTLNIIPTVRTIVSFGLANFINFIKTGQLKKMILVDAFSFMVDAF